MMTAACAETSCLPAPLTREGEAAARLAMYS